MAEIKRRGIRGKTRLDTSKKESTSIALTDADRDALTIGDFAASGLMNQADALSFLKQKAKERKKEAKEE